MSFLVKVACALVVSGCMTVAYAKDRENVRDAQPSLADADGGSVRPAARESERTDTFAQCISGERIDAPFGSNCLAVGYACMLCSLGEWVCDGYIPGTQSCH